MAIDPKAAAAAAQAAAEAARAAAEEAAREAAIAAARAEAAAGVEAGTSTTSRTIAGSETRQVLDDTGVDLGSELSGGQAGSLSDLRDTQTNLAAAGPANLLELPELGSISGRTGADLSMPGLDGGATGDGGSAYMGKAGLMDGGALRDAIASTPYYNQGTDGGTPDAGTTTGQQGGWMGDRDGQGFLSTQGARTRYRFNDDTGEVEATTTTEGTANEDTTTTAGAQGNAGQVEGGAVKDDDAFGTFWEGVKEKVGGWWDSLGGDDSDADGGSTGTDGGSSGGDAGAAGGGVGDVPSDFAPVTLPPGWVNVDDLDFVDEQRKAAGAVPGSKGGDPLGGDDEDGRLSPQGGGWAVNPNPQGDIATNVQTAVPYVSGADLFGQPEPEKDPIDGDPTLMQPPAMVDPNTVNPSRADSGETSDAGAQASTAYRAMPAAADSEAGATDAASIGDGGELDASMPTPDDGGLGDAAASTDDIAQPFFAAAEEADGGRGHAYGRDGDRGSHARGGPGDRPDDGDDAA